MKKKLSKFIFAIASLSLMAAFSTTAFSLYTGTTPANKEMTISIELPETTGFYVKVYRESSLVDTQSLVVNPSNDSELMISGLSLQKGDRFKATDNTNWFGSTSSYSHNISVGASVASSLVSNDGDYVAVQTGTYDVYFRFSDSTYTSYIDTYVNVNNVREVYLQDTWGENYSPSIHYWGDNVIVSNSDNYVAGTKMSTQEGGHDMYKVIVPSQASTFNIYYQSKYSNNVDFDNVNNSYYVYWDDAMKIAGYNWANPL